MYQLPVGIYCIKRYAIGKIDVKILYGGICFEVIQGVMNYPGHIIASYDTTYFKKNPAAFVKKMNQGYPEICKEFLLELCQENYEVIDISKVKFVM